MFLTFARVGDILINCGEAYVNEAIATDLLQTAEQMAQAGAQLDVRRYVPVMTAI